MSLPTTPSQTVGPFFSLELPFEEGPYLVPEGAPGAIWIRGKVLDGEGNPVPDAVLEFWQADAEGRDNHTDDPSGGTDFRGWGRAATDRDGHWGVSTVKPGAAPDNGTPHIAVSVFARGLLNRVVTRIYFADEDNSADPVLNAIGPERRETLLASPAGDGYRIDIRLQGERETVFFDV